MSRSIKFGRIVLPLMLFSLSCDSLKVQDVDEFVVESYLVAGRQLPFVRLSRATEIGETYNFTDLAVRNASVLVEMVDSNGDPLDTFVYTERDDLYWPNDVHLVLPGRTYRLSIDVPGATEQISATTIVPGDFSIVESKPDSVLYQGDIQFEVNVTESLYPGRDAVFVFSVESLEPSLETLTPFYREIVDPDDDGDDDELDDVIVNESFVINEANFDKNPDGTFTIRLPWLAVAFYGPNNIVVNTLDDNMYDFLRSHTVQQGGSTFSPGEIPNVIDNVAGGTGVFGSITRKSAEVFVKEREL